MSNRTLYQYITENFDAENESFTQATLIDEPHLTVPHPLGAEDAFWFCSNAASNPKGAEEIYRLFKEYLNYPDQARKQKLYEALAQLPIITIAEPLCDKLQSEDIDERALSLGRTFFYNAKHRGPLKFAYILLGFYGVERIINEDAELWSDMVAIAKCEEFTYFFIFACTISNYKPQKAIWRLIGCTEGWGRVFSIEAAECQDEAQELWLIQHGMEINVDYPPLAAHILERARVSAHLAEKEINYRTFKGVAIILNAFLNLLDHYDESVLEENLNTVLIQPVQLLHDFLRHAKIHATKPEDILHILNLSFGLRNLERNKGICVIEDNALHILMAECDSIIYAKDWQQYVNNNIVHSDSLNYELCDFACEMDMDIRKPLFNFLCEHPYEYKVMAYLLSFNDEICQKKTMDFVEHNLSLYRTEESALLIPLRYLEHYPGCYETVIIAALRSLYDWPRGVACSVLNFWGMEYLTEPLKQALEDGLRLSNNQVVTERIRSLLLGRQFNIDTLLEE